MAAGAFLLFLLFLRGRDFVEAQIHIAVTLVYSLFHSTQPLHVGLNSRRSYNDIITHHRRRTPH